MPAIINKKIIKSSIPSKRKRVKRNVLSSGTSKIKWVLHTKKDVEAGRPKDAYSYVI